MSEPMQLFIKKFWTDYRPKKDGSIREVDMVEYSPIGSIQKTSIPKSIKEISSVIPLEGKGAHNPAVLMAHARWNAIKPYYEAWKAGREVPVDGTPLAVWSGLTPEQAELFKMKGVKTVEQIAALTDTHKQSMGIPGLHGIIDNAKRFLTAQEKSVVTDALVKKDAEIAALTAQMAELIEMVKEAKSGDAPAVKRRGRPPKSEQAAA